MSSSVCRLLAGLTMSLYWSALIALSVLAFTAGKIYALRTDKLTLSRFIWNASKAWPLLPFILGLIAGGAAVHLFWHWCPDVGSGIG